MHVDVFLSTLHLRDNEGMALIGIPCSNITPSIQMSAAEIATTMWGEGALVYSYRYNLHVALLQVMFYLSPLL